jgi:AcrR family transcriptional regulator
MKSPQNDQQPDVRRLVLDAAIAIITSTGAESLSMREVARQAGVSHQAPYHYFKDRSGIFAAISEEGFQRLAHAFRAVSNTASSTGESAAKLGFQAYVRFAIENTGHFRVMFRSDICGISTHSATTEAADDAFNELLEMVRHTVGSSIDAHASFTFALMMWSHAHGLSTLVLDGPLANKLPAGTDLQKQVHDVIDLTAHMVSRQAAEMGLVPAAN